MPIAEKHTGMWSYLSHTCDSDGNALCCLHILTARLQSHDLQSYPAARSTNTFISPRREFQCNLYMLVYMYVFNSHVLLLHLIELMWIIKHVLSNVFHEDWLWLCPTIKHAATLNIISRFSGFDPCWTNLEKCEYITQQT